MLPGETMLTRMLSGDEQVDPIWPLRAGAIVLVVTALLTVAGVVTSHPATARSYTTSDVYRNVAGLPTGPV